MKYLLVALFAWGCLATLQAQSDAGKLELTLRAELTPGREIRCALSIRNPTNAAVEVQIPNDNPPFLVSVWDASGRDLNENAYSPVKRGKSQHRPSGQQLTTLSLAPKEARSMEGTVTLRAEDGSAIHLARGKYFVEVRLATVRHVDGKYETTLFHSGKVEVSVQD